MTNLVFGSEAQRRMALVSVDLWPLARHNPALLWNGRLVSVSAVAEPDLVTTILRLVALQGATSVHFLPKYDAPALIAELEAEGLSCSRYFQAEGGKDTYMRSLARLADTTLPDGFVPLWIGEDTPRDIVVALGNLAASSGVTPACEAAMRGLGPPSAVLGLADPVGRLAACGMSFLGYPPDGTHGDVAFWGMLATSPDHRGRGLASYIGATLVRRMWEAHGARLFITGIAPDNSVSLRMCAGLLVEPRGRLFLGVTDPKVFGSGGVTR